jgi:hypothetical protein
MQRSSITICCCCLPCQCLYCSRHRGSTLTDQILNRRAFHQAEKSGKSRVIILGVFEPCFYPRELAKSCFVVVVVVVLFLVVACLLVLYSMKQFENVQQESHAHIQVGILPLYCSKATTAACMQFATASDCRALVCSLRNCRCSRAAACAYMQLENLPLQPGSSHVAARNYPAVGR